MTAATYHLDRQPVPPRGGGVPEQGGGPLFGRARHVTRDGCQFVITGPSPRHGSRLTCRLSVNPPVTGVVRWVVEDRMGFAFDVLLDAATLAELTSPSVRVSAIALEPSGDSVVQR